MSIAAFDIIDLRDFYDSMLVLPYTKPLSPKLEVMGFESLLIIYNMGSVTLFALTVLFLMIVMHAIRKRRFHVKIRKILRSIRRIYIIVKYVMP